VPTAVKHDKHRATCERIHQRGNGRAVRLIGEAELVGDGGWNRHRFGDNSQIDKPHTVSILAAQLGSDLDSEPRLTHTTDTSDRDHPIR
jgi:hypothetical protein